MAATDRITIQDIAERSNVSISTVSRVLSGSARVSEKKRRAVMNVVDELDYQPNPLARGLASGNSLSIGVMTQNVGSPFYDAITRGVVKGFDGTDYSPLIVDGQWRLEVEERLLRTLLTRQVDGLIIIGGNLTPERLASVNRQTPLIQVARHIEALSNHCICSNNFQAGYAATRYLIESGHTRIAHITGPSELQDAEQRQSGYLAALREANIEVDHELIVAGNFRQQAGLLAVESLLARGKHFSAIFAANDQMAFGARLALYRRGIRVPEDISLVGFDDQNASAFMTPPLTTVRQPAEEMGEAAARALLQLINNESPAPQQFEAELIIRESVARIR